MYTLFPVVYAGSHEPPPLTDKSSYLAVVSV